MFLKLLAGPLLLAITAQAVDSSRVTFNRDVLPVLQKRCQGCHRPGEAAPFSMLTYRDTRPWAKAIREAVRSRKMPPWMADENTGHWKNNPTLSNQELNTVVGWVDGGALEGDAKDAPEPLKFVEGWNIGQPDAVFEMPAAYEVPARGTIDYQWIVIPTGFREDKWIQAVEVRPGNRSVVHHVLAFYRLPGSKWLADAKPGIPTPKSSGSPEVGMSDGNIGGYAPGVPPLFLPNGRAILLPAGADIVLQLHYTSSGSQASDRTKVGIVFAKQPTTERRFAPTVANRDFVIPPGEPNFRLDAAFTFDVDTKVIGFLPHMHLRGKSFEYRAVLPDGRRETLLRVPKYDFNWQLEYQLAEERVFPAGTTIECSAWFDNSANNRWNPDPKAAVHFGDQTWDEMMVGFVVTAIDPNMPPSKLIRKEPDRKSGDD